MTRTPSYSRAKTEVATDYVRHSPSMAAGDSRTADKRLRVAQVLWSGEIGGSERSGRDLAAGLDRRHFEAAFFFLSKGGPFARQLVDMGFATETLGWRNGRSVAGRWRLAHALRNFSPAVVHAHQVPPLTALWIRMGAPTARIILSEHGKVELVMRGRPSRFALWLNAIAYRRAARVIVHSRYMAERLERAYRVPSAKLALIYLGIDLQEFDPRSREYPPVDQAGADGPPNYRIGYVGRIYNAQKGVDYLPRLARLLMERGCNDFEICIAGDGVDRQATERLCREMRVDHKVTFLGWQPDVPAFLQTLDVVVVPSRFEPFGLVTIEALAMGVRVIAFDVGGIAEAVEGCEDAKLIPQDDVTGLVDAILDFKQQFGRSRAIHSRSYVQQRFDRRRMAREIEAVYLHP